MTGFTGKGHGKIILFGEHAVVYGKPALGIPLTKGIRVTLSPIPRLPHSGKALHPDPLDDLGREAFTTAARASGIDPTRWRIVVRSNLPVGQGLGSSAAFSVAVARALLKATGRKERVEVVLRLARILENVFHGKPSGIDALLAVSTTPLLYRIECPPESIQTAVPIPLAILLTGTSPATRLMIRRVREKYRRNRKRTGRIFDEIEKLSLAAAESIRTGELEDLGRLMNENHHLLFDLGVSTPLLEYLRQKALAAGSMGAKLTGGGGGGAVVCLARSLEQAKKIVKKLKMEKNSLITVIKNSGR